MKKITIILMVFLAIAMSTTCSGQEIMRGEEGIIIEVKETLNDSTSQVKLLTQSAKRLNAQFKNSIGQISYIYRDTNNGLFVVLFDQEGQAYRHWFRRESNIYSLLNKNVQ